VATDRKLQILVDDDVRSTFGELHCVRPPERTTSPRHDGDASIEANL
jgi:hypothetical protein